MLSIKDLRANQELDRAARAAVIGGSGLPGPGFALSNLSRDLFDVVGEAHQFDLTSISNVGNHGSLILNIVDNDKDVNV